jgi:putative endonuclease
MQYYVYIMTNSLSTVLYIGMTNNLERRVWEHKQKLVPGFTSKYNVNTLVYFEETSDVREAIYREKQLKGWTRARKVDLVATMNREWRDLSAGWNDEEANVEGHRALRRGMSIPDAADSSLCSE